jgi:hypothetical protein
LKVGDGVAVIWEESPIPEWEAEIILYPQIPKITNAKNGRISQRVKTGVNLGEDVLSPGPRNPAGIATRCPVNTGQVV